MSTIVLPRHPEARPELARILALSVAISLNGAMLLLAMRPLPARLSTQPTSDIVPVVTFEVTPPPAPAPPPPIPALPHPRVHAPTPVHRVPVPPAQVVPTPMSTPPVAIQSPPVPPHATGGPASDTAPTGPMQAHLTYLRAPPPRYPALARRARMQGTVILRVRVDAGGHPVQVQVEHSSGHPVLDRAARRQVAEKWLFKPAQVKGQATPAWALVPVQFRLRSD